MTLRATIEAHMRERGWERLEDRHPEHPYGGYTHGKFWTRPKYDEWWRAPVGQTVKFVLFHEAIVEELNAEEHDGNYDAW